MNTSAWERKVSVMVCAFDRPGYKWVDVGYSWFVVIAVCVYVYIVLYYSTYVHHVEPKQLAGCS